MITDWGMLPPTDPDLAVDKVVGSWMVMTFEELTRLLRIPPDVTILAVRAGPDAHSLVIDMAGKLPTGAVQAIYKATMVRDTKFSCWVPADAP